jgi:hypothetical protein
MPMIQTQVRSMQDQDGAVLLDLKGGKYFSLNGVGADIWTQLEKGLSLPHILDYLDESYQATREQLERDLTAFVEGLAKKGLIRVDA